MDVCWYKDATGKQVYFDQSIVGTTIAYESQKINKINNNDSSVLNLVKEGTPLYKKVKKLGKTGEKQSYKTLKIGEIRQASNVYYIWVAQVIKTANAGTVTTKKVFELQPDGQAMKVVAEYKI